MRPFTRLDAIAVPLDLANVDTDQLLPARFLKKPRGAGLSYADYLLRDLRFRADGTPDPDVGLNRPPFDRAEILVADANFGCGSSREGAVYALLDFGIRAVIAPSFGDIFAGNAAKNGVLTVELSAARAAALRAALHAAPGARVAVDLAAQTVTAPDGETLGFAIDPFRKTCLLGGLDDIALTQRHADAIAAFEAADAAARPWAAVREP